MLGLGVLGGASAAPAMWVVRDADSQIYLFGTLHALSPAAEWRTPAYDAAYQQATTVWFEADMEAGDPGTVRQIVEHYGSDPDKPLSDKLTPADVGALARQGVDLGRIDHLRPWAAALMLSMQPALGRGARVESGADLTMTRASRASAKQIKTFETLEDQARMYASLPETSEVAYLSGVIHERTGGPMSAHGWQNGRSLEQAWLAGDLARLGPALVGDMKADNPAFYDALLKRRNLAWADKLADELKGSGTELVNVGALHMVGPDGLPALLAARGYTVQRVQ
jgi:uncharacterized protein YbaP (TraB family)